MKTILTVQGEFNTGLNISFYSEQQPFYLLQGAAVQRMLKEMHSM